MKDLSDVTAVIVDYGKFLFLAEMMAGAANHTYYYSPTEREFEDARDAYRGDGIEGVERLDSFLDPQVLEKIDLFIFPDIGFAGTQRYLKSIGKAVWGAMGANELELSRTKFLKMLDTVGLQKVHSVKLRGLNALAGHLKENENKWVKINRFRAEMETWQHLDWVHSEQKMDELAVQFGGLKEDIVFVVQDEIECDVEIGYDGWCVNGQYPDSSFQGYELKNELYLGSLLDYNKLPKEVIEVNEAISPVLKRYGYRNFMATEIRVKDGVPYFIDPTFRMAGLTEDQLPTTCSNLPEVIWQGANGHLIKPEFIAKYVAVATMHYTKHVKDYWFQIAPPPQELRQWFKLYHYCEYAGMIHFIPSVPYECDEAGVVIGAADTIKGAIDNLKENFKVMESEPLTIDVAGFVDLLQQVKDAENEGMEFSDKPIPQPESVI